VRELVLDTLNSYLFGFLLPLSECAFVTSIYGLFILRTVFRRCF